MKRKMEGKKEKERRKRGEREEKKVPVTSRFLSNIIQAQHKKALLLDYSKGAFFVFMYANDHYSNPLKIIFDIFREVTGTPID
ncbi:hypothetical protein JNUCC1_02403 [Lentibacillus sp. JNUCC-1]|nr:hypothetical protein [Lentibacillus sp. JNUCC-1]